MNAKSWESCRQSLFLPGPVNCGSTPLCNVGKQTRGFQKQGNDCFEKNVSEGALAKLELHLSCWIPQLAYESELASQNDWRLHHCVTPVAHEYHRIFALKCVNPKTGDGSENCLSLKGAFQLLIFDGTSAYNLETRFVENVQLGIF